MPNFGDMVKETLAFKSIKGEGDITGSIYYKGLNKICVRFQNKYINNIDKHRSLKESIRANGLIEPIDSEYSALYEELNEKILKEIKTCGFENYHTDNYWSFMEELNTLLMCHLSNHPGLMNKMHDILNNRILSKKISPKIMQRFLVMQSIGKNYDYLNDVYQKKLTKGNK